MAIDAATHRGPYDGVRVVELRPGPEAEATGRLLAELGADVVKLEPPQGSAARAIGPFAHGIDDGDHSLTFWYYNRNKRSVVADHDDDPDPRMKRLIETADVVLTGMSLEELVRADLVRDGVPTRPNQIVVAVTPFGLTGPWAGYQSSDLVALAAGGPLASCGYDDLAIPPIRPGGNQGYHTAASFGHIGVLLALIERRRSGRGQLVDVSMHESLAVNVELANPYWFYTRTPVRRQTCRHAQPSMTQPALFEAQGGYVYFVLITTDTRTWERLVAWMDSKDLAADLTEPAYLDPKYRQDNFPHIQSMLEVFFLLQDARDVYREGQAHQLPIGILHAPEDLAAYEHLKERGYFQPVHHDDVGDVLFPGTPYRFSAFEPPAAAPAPALGEHTAQLLPDGVAS